MSYQTHNLKIGDIFWSPQNLDQYDSKLDYYLWRVVNVLHGFDVTYINAVCLGDGPSPGVECFGSIDNYFNKYISLCMWD
jgi:hypothetical protein